MSPSTGERKRGCGLRCVIGIVYPEERGSRHIKNRLAPLREINRGVVSAILSFPEPSWKVVCRARGKSGGRSGAARDGLDEFEGTAGFGAMEGNIVDCG